MVCCLDLRGDSKLSKFLGNKLVSIISGIVQLVIWVGLLNLIFPSGQLRETLQQASTAVTEQQIAIVFVLINIAFSVLLLFGLFKDNSGFMKTYLVANGVMTTLIIVGFFTNLFVNPQKFGVIGFLSIIIIILLNVLFYFIIRNYYLAFTSTKQPANYAGHV